MKNRAEKRKYIEAAGWTLMSNSISHYADPEDPKVAKGGGLNIEYAYEKQFRRERWGAGLSVYSILPTDSSGLLGFCIVERKHPDSRVIIYQHHIKQILCDAVEQLSSNGTCSIVNDDGYDYGCIAIFEESDNTRYFRVSNYEELLRVCLTVVKERNKEGYYDYDLEEPKLPINKELFEQLPKGALRDAAMSEHRNYLRKLKEYKQNLDKKKILDLALNGDAESAYRIIKNRSNDEYEGFELVQLEIIGA